jgi:hypothetical protein
MSRGYTHVPDPVDTIADFIIWLFNWKTIIGIWKIIDLITNHITIRII